MIPDKHLQTLAPCLMGHNGKPLVRNVVIDNQSLESYLSEEELLDEEDEADMSLMPQNVLHLHVTVTHWPLFMCNFHSTALIIILPNYPTFSSCMKTILSPNEAENCVSYLENQSY